jgi:hypothetical protein
VKLIWATSSGLSHIQFFISGQPHWLRSFSGKLAMDRCRFDNEKNMRHYRRFNLKWLYEAASAWHVIGSSPTESGITTLWRTIGTVVLIGSHFLTVKV